MLDYTIASSINCEGFKKLFINKGLLKIYGFLCLSSLCNVNNSLTFHRLKYAIFLVILANTPNQADTLLHSLERAAAGIGLYINAHKTEYMCYNKTEDISTLNGTPLKLVDKFTYRGSSVASTEKDIDTRLTKVWTAINRLSIIWKSDLTDKMKRSFFQGSGRIDTAIWMHYMDANKTPGEEARPAITQECCEQS